MKELYEGDMPHILSQPPNIDAFVLCTMPQFSSEKYVVNQDFSNWIFSLQNLYKRNPVDWPLFYQKLLKSVSPDVQDSLALKQPKSLSELAAYLDSDYGTPYEVAEKLDSFNCTLKQLTYPVEPKSLKDAINSAGRIIDALESIKTFTKYLVNMKGLKHEAAVRKSINGGPMMLRHLSKWIFLLPPGQWQDGVTVTEEQDENLLHILIETYKKYQQRARTSLDYFRMSETIFALQNEPSVSQHLEQQLLSQEQNQQQNHY